MPTLVTNGFYAYVRHPIYTITLASLFVSTIFTVDRILFIIGNDYHDIANSKGAILYLSVGVPYEEKKLIEIFGNQYKIYSKKVPAIIPFLPVRQ
jgi:protein-S-isoprenylcysteine O-methyltransferase Ste14